MENRFELLDKTKLQKLSSIIYIGTDSYYDFIEKDYSMSHKYLANDKNKIFTKFIQMQCEIESRESEFPFKFREKRFPFNQIIPELYDENIILHFCQCNQEDILPSKAKYKIIGSYNNNIFERQLTFLPDTIVRNSPLYGIVSFGRNKEQSPKILLPLPGYNGIAHTIQLPQIYVLEIDKGNVERKKAILKSEVLKVITEGIK